MCIGSTLHHTLINPMSRFHICHTNRRNITCPYPICPMKQGICCRYGVIKKMCGKTEGDKARVPSSQAITRAGQGPPGVRAYICMYKYTDQVFQTGNHKVYIRTMIPHSYTYSDIFVTHYPKPYTKMLPYVRLGVDMFY